MNDPEFQNTDPRDAGWRDTDPRDAGWHDELPPGIQRLAGALAGAYHAFDDIGATTIEYQVRVMAELIGTVPDIAYAAARDGYGVRALATVEAIDVVPPFWADSCPHWSILIETCVQAIGSGADDAADAASEVTRSMNA